MCDLKDSILINEEISTLSVTNTEKYDISSNCVKCKQVLAIVFIRKDTYYCRECFVDNFLHKIRVTLSTGKSDAGIEEAEENVIVACSGSLQCLVLLHALTEPWRQNPMRPRHPSHIKVVYIRNCNVDSNKFSMINEFSSCLNIQDCVEIDFTKPFSSIDNQTSSDSEYFDQICIRRTLSEFATKNSYKYIYLGSTATSITSQAFSCLARGNGSHIPSISSIYDHVDNQFIFVKPLRDHTHIEIEAYANIFDIKLNEFIEGSLSKNKQSIDQVTSKFLKQLDKEFPGTTNVISRTIKKVYVTDHSSYVGIQCSACKMPVFSKSSKSNEEMYCYACGTLFNKILDYQEL